MNISTVLAMLLSAVIGFTIIWLIGWARHLEDKPEKYKFIASKIIYLICFVVISVSVFFFLSIIGISETLNCFK